MVGPRTVVTTTTTITITAPWTRTTATAQIAMITPTGIPTTATGPVHPAKGLMDGDTDRWVSNTLRFVPKVMKYSCQFPTQSCLTLKSFAPSPEVLTQLRVHINSHTYLWISTSLFCVMLFFITVSHIFLQCDMWLLCQFSFASSLSPSINHSAPVSVVVVVHFDFPCLRFAVGQ